MALRTPDQRGQGCMFPGVEPGDPDVLDRLAGHRTLEAAPQAKAQRSEPIAAEQALQPHVAGVAHAGAYRRSGSVSSVLALPSQLQRETKIASMPSRRCSWQIATPGSSA